MDPYLADALIWLPAPTDFTVTWFTVWPTDVVVMVALEAAFEDWTCEVLVNSSKPLLVSCQSEESEVGLL